jgi:hypothetical protein
MEVTGAKIIRLPKGNQVVLAVDRILSLSVL